MSRGDRNLIQRRLTHKKGSYSWDQITPYTMIPNAERLLAIYFRCDFTYNATFDIDTMYLLQDKKKTHVPFEQMD